ncbi:MAG TPA: hypothetical protein VK475_05620 [Pyrinomonadaceae bacterium]|nr:hypothetical protein [Pyrinomonadaceae bacterium]
MKILLVLALLSLPLTQTPAPQAQLGLEVVSLNVKEKVVNPQVDLLAESQLPDSVTRPNPNSGRPTNRTESETDRLERQTNLRVQNMHAIEAAKKEAGAERPSSVKLYESEAEIKNGSAKPIARFVWAYRASPELQLTNDQEFLCDTKLAAGETKRVKVISVYPNQKVVKVSAAGAPALPAKPTVKDVIINEIEFADGTKWERPNWNPLILATIGARNVSKGKCGPL